MMFAYPLTFVLANSMETQAILVPTTAIDLVPSMTTQHREDDTEYEATLFKTELHPSSSDWTLGWRQYQWVYRSEVNLAITDYTEVAFNATIGVITGPVNLSIWIDADASDEYPTWPYLEGFILVDSRQSKSLLIDLPISTYLNLTREWIVTAYFSISVEGDGLIEFSETSIEIIARSERPLCPAIFDFQSTDGRSLFEDKLWQGIRRKPILNFTRDNDTGKFGIFLPARVEDTIYLNPGNFSGTAGWPYEDWRSGPLYTPLSVQFPIVAQQSVFVSLRLPTMKLEIDLSQDLPFYHMIIEYSGHPFDDIMFVEFVEHPMPESLDLAPYGEYLSVELCIPTPWSWSRSRYWSSYRSSSVETIAAINGTYNLRLECQFPFKSYFGVVLFGPELLLLGLTIASMILGIIHLRRQGTSVRIKEIMSDPRLLPILLLMVGGLSPWFSVRETHSNLQGITWYEYVPLGIETATTGIIPNLPILHEYWVVILLYTALGYWLPILYLMTKLGRPIEWKPEPLMCGVLFLPVLIAVLSIVPYLYSGYLVSPWILPVFMAPIIWYISLVIYRNRWFILLLEINPSTRASTFVFHPSHDTCHRLESRLLQTLIRELYPNSVRKRLQSTAPFCCEYQMPCEPQQRQTGFPRFFPWRNR